MRFFTIIFLIFFVMFFSCNHKEKSTKKPNDFNSVKVVGQMKDVMWKGELFGKISLDTISNTKGLYGLGPKSYLSGEILINNGKTYTSEVLSDSTMIVEENNNVEAPFFVYSNVTEWNIKRLPDSLKSIAQLEKYITEASEKIKKPFAFKLYGDVSKATIHIQNLPKNTKVSSPKEAHQGQTNYNIENKDVEIIGFFSKEHQGIFTHHDSFLHMHLITRDLKKMGHLDNVIFNEMTLFLPKP